MPTYEFQCQKCGHQEDVSLSIAERNSRQRCTVCLGRAVRQQTFPHVNLTTGAQSHSQLNGGRGEYYSQLARRMPFAKNDPSAYFTDPEKARDAAKKHAEKNNKHYERVT